MSTRGQKQIWGFSFAEKPFGLELLPTSSLFHLPVEIEWPLHMALSTYRRKIQMHKCFV